MRCSYACALILLAIGSAGCDVIFGIDDIAQKPRVTGRLRLRQASNDNAGLPIVTEASYPTSAVEFAAFLDDGTPTTVSYRDDGTFDFAAPLDARYRLLITAEGIVGEYQHSARELEIVRRVSSSAGRRPVAATTVEFPYPDVTVAMSTAYLYTTGLWTQTDTGKYGPTVKFDWRLANPTVGGTPTMLDGALNDRIYTAELDLSAVAPAAGGSPPGTYVRIHAISPAMSITQTPGSTAPIAQPVIVEPDRCVRFSTQNTIESQRVIAAYKRDYTRTVSNWYLYASPAPSLLGLAGSIWVTAAGQIPASDLDLLPRFIMPFAGHTTIVSTGAYAMFNVHLGAAAPVELGNSVTRYHVIESGDAATCGAAHEDLASRVAIVGAAALEGIALDTDDAAVPLPPTGDPELAWSLGAGGLGDYSAVTLFELGEVDASTTLVVRRGFITDSNSITIDRALLEPGHTYAFAIGISIGNPGAAAGDFATFTFPSEGASTWTHTFVVH